MLTNWALRFQIADDILDAVGDPAVVGKATDKDAAAGKATFVSLLGVKAARETAGPPGVRGHRGPDTIRRPSRRAAGGRPLRRSAPELGAPWTSSS